MSYPAGATTRTVIDGYRTTVRTAAMVKEARTLYRTRGFGSYPKITQGGYNKGGVAASAGTHDQDAMDDKISVLTSSTKKKAWERCNWEVGFAGWRRPYIAGLWGEHFHKLPKFGQLSDGADNQIKQWYQGDDALRSDRDYPGILSSGLASRSWEEYLDLYRSGHVDLEAAVIAFQTGTRTTSNDIPQIQKRLNHYVGTPLLLVDGIPGAQTRAAYKIFQSRYYGISLTDPDANGIPGADSLTKLGFTVT